MSEIKIRGRVLSDYIFTKYRCKKCNHIWYPRLPRPKRCPICESHFIEPITVRVVEVIID